MTAETLSPIAEPVHRPFRWTRASTRAAQYVADRTMTNDEIAAACNVAEVTVRRWRQRAEFAERVREITEAMAQALLSEGIAQRAERMRIYNDQERRMSQVITERATDPAMQDVPGGKTGLMVHTYKSSGGKDAYLVDEYAVDTGLVKTRLDNLKQAAQDLGQWSEKQEHVGEVGIRHYLGINVEAV